MTELDYTIQKFYAMKANFYQKMMTTNQLPSESGRIKNNFASIQSIPQPSLSQQLFSPLNSYPNTLTETNASTNTNFSLGNVFRNQQGQNNDPSNMGNI
jgi:hypothetical protein